MILVTSSNWINCSFSRTCKVRISCQNCSKICKCFFIFKTCQTVARHKYDQSISQFIFFWDFAFWPVFVWQIIWSQKCNWLFRSHFGHCAYIVDWPWLVGMGTFARKFGFEFLVSIGFARKFWYLHTLWSYQLGIFELSSFIQGYISHTLSFFWSEWIYFLCFCKTCKKRGHAFYFADLSKKNTYIKEPFKEQLKCFHPN